MKPGVFRLAKGREVFLSRLHVEGTYNGQMEGSPETCSPYLLESVASETARQLLPPGTACVILPPENLPLPRFRWVAEFESCGGARREDSDFSIFHSRLVVCWFGDDLGSIHDTACRALERIDWEAMAPKITT